MKIEDLAYAIVQKVFDRLLHDHHFHVPPAVVEAVRKDVLRDLKTLIK